MTIEHFLPVDYAKVPCRANPERQFPNTSGAARTAQEIAAKAVCRTGDRGRACPALDRCLSYAIRYDVEGIWGATSEDERQAIRDEHGIEPVSLASGSVRHLVYRRAS